MTQRLAVFVAVSLGWVLFRAPSVSAAFGIVQRMLSIRVNKDAVRLSVLPFTNDHTALAAALVTTCLIVTMFVAERRRAEKQSAFPSAIGTAGVFVCVILFGILRPTSFIYFQF